MSADRPTVSPELAAAMIESTPERVRRRLDRAPDVAEGWAWLSGEAAWSVETGGETVSLPTGHIVEVEQLSCTCLLSPRCFHVLACLTRLEVVLVESPLAEESKDEESVAEDEDGDLVEPSQGQQLAARELVESMSLLLRVGVSGSGVVVQSGLFRAIHRCRVEGLHRPAALGMRVIAGSREIRARSPSADPAQLAEDMADVLETCHHVLRGGAVAGFWIGTARRKQVPVRPRRLLGLFAEPIVTRSGYAGAVAYLLGEDGRIYSASDVRPGDAQLARDAYLGGIEIGPMTRSAKQLARGSYLGTDLTASADGRLGRGKGARIVEQGSSSWQAEAIAERFRRPLTDQWEAISDRAAMPGDAREAGWDLVFLEGTVLGAAGPELLLQAAADPRTLRLAIANESEILRFRENLRMLSHAPGLRVQVIGRLDLQEPGVITPLAISEAPAESRADREPRLKIPESWGGRVCLGFDELRHDHLRNARPSAVRLRVEVQPAEDPLGPLRRRWIAAMMSGMSSRRPIRSNRLRAEVASLQRSGYASGAALLDAISSATTAEGPSEIDTFLAAALYLQACSLERGSWASRWGAS